MDTTDLLASWSSLSLQEIENRLEAGTDIEAAEQLFGAEEVSEMQGLLQRPRVRGLREAIVLLPGIMGSLLSSIRGVTTLLWINPILFLKGQSAYLELNEDGSSDRRPEIDAVAIALERLVYTKIGLVLRRQVDLYEFPYDWRRPIEWNGDLLHACIARWADGDPDRRFTLVGHSMGGLVSRAYLARHTATAERHVKDLIMLGTPHFGASESVNNLIAGNRMMAIVAKLHDKNVPQRLMMNLPSVYQLLPAPPHLFPPHRPYPANWDLYNADAWQLEGLRQDYLDAARGFYELLAGADAQVPLTEIAGCNLDTLVEMHRSLDPSGKPVYALTSKDEGPDAGDGTVPLWSAILPDATVYYIQEGHRSLPRNRDVIDAILDLVHGGTPNLPMDLPRRRRDLVPRSMPAPVDLEAERLRACLEDGTATGEELAQLYFAF